MPAQRKISPSLSSLLLTLTLLCTAAIGIPASAQEAASAFEPLHTHIEEVLGDELATDRAGLLLIHGGDVVYERYFGDYHAGSVVPLGSASQWLSATLILTLVDSAHLDLDSTLGDIVDSLPEGTKAIEVPSDKRRITLRQLLNHTSGLPSQHVCLAEADQSLAECAEAILNESTMARPGRQFHYGAASYQVAGYLAELTTGKSWHALFQERLAEPLGLSNTQYGDSSNPPIATGARSNAGDYAVFLEMLLQRGLSQGQRLLSEGLVTELLSDQRRNARVSYSPHPGMRYTLGAWRDGDRLSCPGLFGFTPWMDLDPGLIGVLQVVAYPEAAGRLAKTLQEEARDALGD